MSHFEEMVQPDFIEVESRGKKYKMTVLRLSDYAKAAIKMREEWRPITDVLQALTKGNGQASDELLKAAYFDERRGGLATIEDVEKWFQTPRGQLYNYWLRFVRYQPNITEEEVDEMMFGISDYLLQRTAGLPVGNSSTPQSGETQKSMSQSTGDA